MEYFVKTLSSTLPRSPTWALYIQGVAYRVGTGCSGYKIFGPPNQSGKIFGRSVEFGWSLVVTNKGKLYKKQDQWVEYFVTYLLKDH